MLAIVAASFILSAFLTNGSDASNPRDCTPLLQSSHPLITHLFKNAKYLEIPGENFSAFDFGVWNKKISLTHRLIREQIERKFKFKANTVLYPLIGFDATTAAVLFPDAAFYIGIDSTQSVPEEIFESKNLNYELETQMGYRIWRWEIHPYPALGRILGQLHQNTPGFRLKKVTLFKLPRVDSPEIAQFRRPQVEFHYEEQNAIHFLIEFDQGPETRSKAYLHIQDDLADPPLGSGHWWQALLSQHPPDAVIIKAAMLIFDPSGKGESWRHSYPALLRKEILRWLRRTEGLLVEGGSASNPSIGAEFSNPRHPFVDVTRAELNTSNEFGYTWTTSVTHFRNGRQ